MEHSFWAVQTGDVVVLDNILKGKHYVASYCTVKF